MSTRQNYKPWLALQYYDANRKLMKVPHILEHEMKEPPSPIDEKILDRIQGSMIAVAIGDALGAHVETQHHEFLVEHPVTDLQAGELKGLKKGQFTDDTSMTLCLANSLVTKGDFSLYDQLVRYKWWFKHGYMSSTGKCFDIGVATSKSLQEFERRQILFAQKYNIPCEEIDYISDDKNLINEFNVYCSEDGVVGNGALMRLAPVPLFFYRFPPYAVEYSGRSGWITHGDIKAYDACRYYGALIVAALQGYTKDKILDKQFYSKHFEWFSERPLCDEIKQVAEGSYQKLGGYEDGIRGKRYIVNALEAALWAFWSDGNSFERGALAAVNLGDDTDTTAAIYGQLAGAYYGYKKLPQHWLQHIYAKKFMLNLSSWITYEGEMWKPSATVSLVISPSPYQTYSDKTSTKIIAYGTKLDTLSPRNSLATSMVHLPKHNETTSAEKNEISKKCYPSYLATSGKHSISSSTLPTNKETYQCNNTISYFNFEVESWKAKVEASVDKSNSNIYSLLTDECAHLVDSIDNSGKTSHDNKQHELALHCRQSSRSTDEHASSMWTTVNRRKSDQDDRNSKVPVERRYSEPNVESSENITFLRQDRPDNPTLINACNVNKHDDVIVAEQKCSPRDILPLSLSSARNSKGTLSTLSTSV
ncbi:unnamed protein product [Rotaria sp. Silwood2]|nr:unnamed protein product [Rotaria sp. Silwood2]